MRRIQWGRSVDTFSKLGAQDLAGQIRDYWVRQGYLVETWIVDERNGRGGKKDVSAIVYGVRSNLLNGLPLEMRQ